MLNMGSCSLFIVLFVLNGLLYPTPGYEGAGVGDDRGQQGGGTAR